jgi:hypothetical protein
LGYVDEEEGHNDLECVDMKAVVFIPDCCGRAKLVADLLKLSVNVRTALDSYLCGKVNPDVAVREIAQLCRRVNGRRSMFGWTLIVEGCEWDDLEDVVAEAGGDIVYMPR